MKKSIISIDGQISNDKETSVEQKDIKNSEISFEQFDLIQKMQNARDAGRITSGELDSDAFFMFSAEDVANSTVRSKPIDIDDFDADYDI